MKVYTQREREVLHEMEEALRLLPHHPQAARAKINMAIAIFTSGEKREDALSLSVAVPVGAWDAYPDQEWG